eukprot:g8079.t1
MFATSTRIGVRNLSLQQKRIRHTSFIQREFAPRAPTLRNCTTITRRGFSTTLAAAVKTGSELANFPEYFQKVKATNGRDVTLSSYKGKKPVVLFFYPKAGTPGCTKQAQKFRDDYNKLTKLGAEVFGISGDSLQEQKDFVSAQSLPYPLLVDEGNALRKGFGIPGDLFGALPGRQTIVIDKSGKCVLSYNNQLNPESHVDEAIKALS